MSESNAVNPESVKPSGETQPETPKAIPAPVVNKRKERTFPIRPLVAPSPPPVTEVQSPKTAEPPPVPAKVIFDDHLNASDAKMEIRVKVHNREGIMVEFAFEATLFDILDHRNRNTGLREMHRLFENTKLSTVTKLNSVLGDDKEVNTETIDERPGKLMKEPMPIPYPNGGMGTPSSGFIHQDPPIEGMPNN